LTAEKLPADTVPELLELLEPDERELLVRVVPELLLPDELAVCVLLRVDVPPIIEEMVGQANAASTARTTTRTTHLTHLAPTPRFFIMDNPSQ
jgi:hypothetical protein